MAGATLMQRDRRNAVVAGVCGALARRWGVDTVVVRVAFVVASVVTGGFAVAAYLALWALLPTVGSTTAPVHRVFPLTATWSSSALVAAVVGASVLAGLAVARDPGGLVMLGLVLLILRFGFSRRRAAAPSTVTPPPAAPPTPFERLAVAWQQRVADVEAGRTDAVGAPVWQSPTGPSPTASAAADERSSGRRRAGARTWWWVLVAGGIAWTGLGALAAGGVVVPPLAWVATTLGVLALTLVAVARPSRAAHGRPPGLLLAASLAALATTALMVDHQVALTSPSTASQVVTIPTNALTSSRDLGVGEHTVDLADAAPAADRQLSLTQDVGTLRVVVPSRGNVVVDYTVGAGEASDPSRNDSGLDLAGTWRRVDDPDAPTLTVNADLDFGRLEVVER